MTKLRSFMIGILLGQAVMIPYILQWVNHPVIVGLPVSDIVYQKEEPYTERIADIMTLAHPKPHPLYVNLLNIDEVRAKYKEIYGETDPNLLGFYMWDDKLQAHEVYCVRSPEVVAHEIRHAFEGAFHRGER